MRNLILTCVVFLIFFTAPVYGQGNSLLSSDVRSIQSVLQEKGMDAADIAPDTFLTWQGQGAASGLFLSLKLKTNSRGIDLIDGTWIETSLGLSGLIRGTSLASNEFDHFILGTNTGACDFVYQGALGVLVEDVATLQLTLVLFSGADCRSNYLSVEAIKMTYLGLLTIDEFQGQQ